MEYQSNFICRFAIVRLYANYTPFFDFGIELTLVPNIAALAILLILSARLLIFHLVIITASIKVSPFILRLTIFFYSFCFLFFILFQNLKIFVNLL